MTATKKCSNCEQLKSINDFYFVNQKFLSRCKSCCRSYVQGRRRQAREKNKPWTDWLANDAKSIIDKEKYSYQELIFLFEKFKSQVGPEIAGEIRIKRYTYIRKILTKEQRIKISKSCNKRINEIREFILKYKTSRGCAVCGEIHPACLDFHHKNPEVKGFTISKSIKARFAIARIKREIDKCILLCANCHRKETASQQGWYCA